MYIALLELILSCVLITSVHVHAMEEASSWLPLKKYQLTQEAWLEFMKSGIEQFAHAVDGKQLKSMGSIRLPNRSFLAVYLGTLKQKNDVCFFTRKIAYETGVPGIQSWVFRHSKIIGAKTITNVSLEVSEKQLNMTLVTENNDEQSNDLLIFEDYLHEHTGSLIKLW